MSQADQGVVEDEGVVQGGWGVPNTASSRRSRETCTSGPKTSGSRCTKERTAGVVVLAVAAAVPELLVASVRVEVTAEAAAWVVRVVVVVAMVVAAGAAVGVAVVGVAATVVATVLAVRVAAAVAARAVGDERVVATTTEHPPTSPCCVVRRLSLRLPLRADGVVSRPSTL